MSLWGWRGVMPGWLSGRPCCSWSRGCEFECGVYFKNKKKSLYMRWGREEERDSGTHTASNQLWDLRWVTWLSLCFFCCIQSPGPMLESSGGFLKILMPMPHPRSTECDSLRWGLRNWYFSDFPLYDSEAQRGRKFNMISKERSDPTWLPRFLPHSPILWSQGMVAGARRIAIAPLISHLYQITVKTIPFTPKEEEGGEGEVDGVVIAFHFH